MGLLSWYAAIALGLSLMAVTEGVQVAEEDRMNRLLDAIARVESRNDPAALGDAGRAVGVYQIHRAYWVDATRVLGVDWDYRDAGNPRKARRAVEAYLRHYGRGKTLLEMARIHNGGPRGHTKTTTLAYARKIEQARTSAC